MTPKSELTAIGLMSGTSLDGIDVAMITGDGEAVTSRGPALYIPYTDKERQQLKEVLAQGVAQGREFAASPLYAEIRRQTTLAHLRAVQALLDENGLHATDIDVIGFHGQTILHAPEDGWTWQMSDGALLAKEAGITVVDDLRAADVAAGGQGAPFAPLYHAALIKQAGLSSSDFPVAILNIGGISNITWIDEAGQIIGFDTGPGNALLNDWVQEHMGWPYDDRGKIAESGNVDRERLEQALQHPYFDQPYPKSLDRQSFTLDLVEGMDPVDGAATLTALTAESVIRSFSILPERPNALFVCGGGRHNSHMLDLMRRLTNIRVDPVESLGWDGDFLEAELFAHLAIRSLKGLPLSLPSTTGAREAVTGGVLHQP